jgi:hypothetical protein
MVFALAITNENHVTSPEEQNLIERHIALRGNEVKKYFLLSMINFHSVADRRHFSASLPRSLPNPPAEGALRQDTAKLHKFNHLGGDRYLS